MTPIPSHIWQVPAYLPYLQPALTDEAVADAERRIGYRLPEAYLDLLRVQNGGYIRLGLPDQVHDMIQGIGPNFPALEPVDWAGLREHVSFSLDGLVPFDGDGHWYLCFDYRQDPISPAVTLADIECNRETRVAASFEEYLALLEEEVEEGDLVISGVSDFTGLVEGLGKNLRVAFEDQGTWAHGYQVYRAKVERPGWIYISPNTVARGFVRENDARYQELKDSLPGEGDRYPGLPPGSYLVGTTEPWIEAVQRACRELQIPVRLLSEFF
jgi:hypothetical protein